MDVDSQPSMEETILVGDDLMLGPPSPLIPPEIASHVTEGVDLCDRILRNLFLCLQINDIEPFCQDEIVLYRQCAEKRDKILRQRLQDSEYKLGLSMPLEEAKERAGQLQTAVTSLERRVPDRGTPRLYLRAFVQIAYWGSTFVDRKQDLIHLSLLRRIYDMKVRSIFSRRMILASGMEGMEGFRQRWSLHGRLGDTKNRLEALNKGMETRKDVVPRREPQGDSVKRRWFFW